MKKILALILACLLLAGCAGNGDDIPTTQPVPSGLYEPGSAIEQATGGAIRAYPLPGKTYEKLLTVGSRIVLASKSGELVALEGDNCDPSDIYVLGRQVSDESLGFSAAPTGIAYYSEQQHSVICLNPRLQQTKTVQLPEEIVGTPAISLHTNEAYYCVGREIRALDLQTNISRKIRVEAEGTIEMRGCCFDGQFLYYRHVTGEGSEELRCISAKTGQIRERASEISELCTCGNTYFARETDDFCTQYIAGTLDGESRSIAVPEETRIQGIPEQNAVISYTQDGGTAVFSLYSCADGSLTAQTEAPGIGEIAAIRATTNHIFVLAADAESGAQTLYRWDPKMSAATGEALAVETLYSADSPDTEGIEQCRKEAKELGNRYGVRIDIWEDAAAKAEEYAATPEHRANVIRAMLENTESVLAMFPDGFLKKTVKSGKICIGFVRSISDDRGWVQFWKDGNCYIIICTCTDAGNKFLQAVGCAIDSHVLGNSRDFDTWDELNPKSFRYDYSYDRYAQRKDSYLTSGSSRAFLDTFSMTYPTQDRSRIFYNAMLPDNAGSFNSTILKAKLKRMCEGIREAYGLEKSKEIYQWEQYLEKPLAKK